MKKLTDGRNHVKFQTVEGTSNTLMSNNMGELQLMSDAEAEQRVAALLAMGWKYAGA